MFLSKRLATDSVYSARTSQYSDKNYQLVKQRTHSIGRPQNNKNTCQKILFRKVIKTRNNHSIVREDSRICQSRHMSESRITKVQKQGTVGLKEQQEESEMFNKSSTESHNIYLEFQEQSQGVKLSQKRNQKGLKKLSFINKLGNAQIMRQKTDEKDQNPKGCLGEDSQIKQDDNCKKSSQYSSRRQTPRVTSAFFTQERPKFNFIKDDHSNVHVTEQNTLKQQVQSNRVLREGKTSRPLSSSSSYSSTSQIKISSRNFRQDSFMEENKDQNKKEKQEKKQCFFESMKKLKQKEVKERTWQEISEEFSLTQTKINRLIEQKWDLIEQQIENHQTNDPQQKSSFSRGILQKNIDIEIMNEIKKLRNLDFGKIHVSSKEIQRKNDIETLIEQLQKRRSQIIEKALAQSMVEAQLMKKYYSGQNYNGLSTSNHKVGQQSVKNKIKLKSSCKVALTQEQQLSSIINTPSLTKEQRPSKQRQLFTKETQNKSNFLHPTEQDYEKYRFKHSDFKPNLQPLPRSAYKCQFFSYGNIKAFDDPYNEQKNMIFPVTSTGTKSSSYRKEYKQFIPEKVNFKEFDAYKNKYKQLFLTNHRQLNIRYMPKKRSESQTNTARKHSSSSTKNHPKFINQVEYVKKLKTESMLDDNDRTREMTQRLAARLFLSESRKEYENPEKSNFVKSQIKHKNLYALKYDFKRKFNV